MKFFTVPYSFVRRTIIGSILTGLALFTLVVLMGHGHRVSAATARPPQDRYSLRDVHTQKKVAALTFDISWGTKMPKTVTDYLIKHHVPATIFVSGPWATHNAPLIKEMAKNGLEVESHGWAHVNYSQLSAAGVAQNISKANTVIEKITGQHPAFVRPPNGDFNRQSIAAARSLGYTTVTWGTDSLDWMNPGVGVIISRVVNRIHPGDIVLMHASDTCKQTDLALPTIIKDLQSKGYKLVTLKQLMTYGPGNYRG